MWAYFWDYSKLSQYKQFLWITQSAQSTGRQQQENPTSNLVQGFGSQLDTNGLELLLITAGLTIKKGSSKLGMVAHGSSNCRFCRQKQEDWCKFKASLLNIVHSKSA